MLVLGKQSGKQSVENSAKYNLAEFLGSFFIVCKGFWSQNPVLHDP